MLPLLLLLRRLMVLRRKRWKRGEELKKVVDREGLGKVDEVDLCVRACVRAEGSVSACSCAAMAWRRNEPSAARRVSCRPVTQFGGGVIPPVRIVRGLIPSIE